MAADPQAGKVQGPDLPGNPLGFFSQPPNVAGNPRVYAAGAATTVVGAQIAPALPAVAGKTNWLRGILISGLGATAAGTIQVTIAGLLSGPLKLDIAIPAGVGAQVGPVVIYFGEDGLQGSGLNTAITATIPAFGAGSTNVDGFVWGYSA